jgi:hypothetical protein
MIKYKQTKIRWQNIKSAGKIVERLPKERDKKERICLLVTCDTNENRVHITGVGLVVLIINY